LLDWPPTSCLCGNWRNAGEKSDERCLNILVVKYFWTSAYSIIKMKIVYSLLNSELFLISVSPKNSEKFKKCCIVRNKHENLALGLLHSLCVITFYCHNLLPYKCHVLFYLFVSFLKQLGNIDP
jgi:hypothetical protein